LCWRRRREVCVIDGLVVKWAIIAMERSPRCDGGEWGESEGSIAALDKERASLRPQIEIGDPDVLDLVGSVVGHLDDAVSGGLTPAEGDVGGNGATVEVRFPDDIHHDGRRNVYKRNVLARRVGSLWWQRMGRRCYTWISETMVRLSPSVKGD
jgi:hypothetical protein